MAWLALDLGWSFGWCTWRTGDVIESGVVRLGRESDDGVRLLAKSQWLSDKRREILAAGETLDDVVYEAITFIGRRNGFKSLHAYGKQLGTVERWCAFHSIRCRGVAWNQVKKHATGNGLASREMMLAAIQQRFPSVSDHNEASAVAVMLTARDKFPLDQVHDASVANLAASSKIR